MKGAHDRATGHSGVPGGSYSMLHARRGLRLLWRRRGASAGFAVLCMVVSFVVYMSISLNAHAKASAAKVSAITEVTATIESTAKGKPALPLRRIAEQAQAIPGVTAVHTLTQQQAERAFATQAPEAYAGQSSSMFRAVVVAHVTHPSDLASVSRTLRHMHGIEQATYPLALARQAVAVGGWLSLAATIIAGLGILGLVGGLVAITQAAVRAERGVLVTIRSVGAGTTALAAPIMVQLAVIVLVAATIASLAGWVLDPIVGSGNAGLPAWLRTGRAYGLFGLWPWLTLSVLLIVETLTFVMVRRASRRPTSMV